MRRAIMALSTVSVVVLTGCGHQLQQVVQAYSDSIEHRDPCIQRGKPAGHVTPTWCGASSGVYALTRDWRTGRYLTVTDYTYRP